VPVIKQIIYYFLVFRKHIGSRLYFVFILTALAATTESFGLAMILPLIDAVGIGVAGESVEQSGIKDALQAILNWLGIGSSTVGILLFIAGAILLKGFIIFSSSAYESHLRSQLMCEMKGQMFDKYSTMDYGYYSKRNTGHFINIINIQIFSLIASFSSFKKFLTTIITTGAYFGMAFLMAWKFAGMALVAGATFLFLFRGLNNYVHGLSRKTAIEQGVLNKFLVVTFH
jgi:ABC-type multidrug transport system fused ATPase/permease subunit